MRMVLMRNLCMVNRGPFIGQVLDEKEDDEELGERDGKCMG